MSQGKYITSNLYAVLRDNGINMPTEEVFYQNMSNPNYRKTLYKGLQEKGFDTESEDEFQVSWHNKFANDPNYKGSGKATSKPVAKSQQSQPTQQSSQRMLSGQRVPKQQHIERVETTRSATPKAVTLYTPNTKSQIKTNEDVALESQPKPKIERPNVDNTEQATKLKSSIETQQDEIKAKIEDAERRRMEAVREYNKKNRFLSAFVASAQQDAGVDPFASGAYGEDVTKITEEIQSLRNQLKRMTDAHDKITTALETKKGDGLFDLQNFKNIGRGIADTFTDSDFWDMGRGEFNANTQMMGISKKIEQGKELTDDELNVVSAELINQSVDQYIQSIGGLPIGYSVGQVTAEATRFMLEMGINPARGASSAITQQLVKKLGVDGIKNIIAKRLATGAIKAVGNVAEAGALVNTMQSMRTAGDAAKRYAGTIDIDNDGNLTVVDNQGMGEALYKAEASAIIENVTELMGGGKLAELTNKGFNVVVKRLGDVISLGKISDFAGKMSATGFGRFVDGMAKRGAWQGFADEVFEEEYGIMLNSLLVGDSSFSDLVDPKQQAEIVLGCAFMDGSIKAIKIGGGAIEYRNVSKKYRKAESKAKSLFTPEQWEMISSNLGGATDAEMGAMLATYLDPNTGLSPEQRQAVAEYAGSMVRYRSFNRMADNVKEESKQQSSTTTPTFAYEVDSDVSLIDDNGDTINGHITGVDEDGNYIVETNTLVNGMRVQPMSADQLDAMGSTNGGEIVDRVQTSTAEGYDITDFDQIGELSMLVDNSRDDVAQALGTTDVDAVLQQALGNNPTDSDIDAQFGDNAQVVKEYVHNRAKLNGSRQRNDDDLDIAIESIDNDIANIANTNGNVVAAKMVSEDGDVYVVDGNIVTYEDGQIDVANSDASVIIQKADGSREMVTPLQLQDIASTPTEQYRDELVQAFTDNYRQTYVDAVNGALDYSQGQQYTMLNADGSTTDVTILADNGDGNVTVTARDGNKEGGVTDGKQIVLTESQIQQGVREFKRNQLRQDKAQQVEQTEQPQQVTDTSEATQEQTPSTTNNIAPRDEQGNVLYGQMSADNAWDMLVEESGGDTDIATMVAQSNIEDAQKALDKAKKQTPKLAGTTEEKLAIAKAFKESVVKAQNDLAAWQAIANVLKARQQAEFAEQERIKAEELARVEAEAKKRAEEQRKADEERRLAEEAERKRIEEENLRKAEEEKLAKEEEERITKEAEAKRLAEEQAKEEERKRIEEENRLAEEARLAKEEAKRQEREQRLAEEKKEADKKVKQIAKTFAGTYQQLGEPMTFEEFVLRELSSGKIKFIWGDNTNNTKGLGAHLGYRSEAERKQRLWMLDNQRGERPEVVAQSLLEDARAQYNLAHNIDDADALNVLLDIVASYPTARSMFDEVVAMHKRAEEAEERYYQELEEQDIYNTYHMSIEEYRDYCDVVEEEIKQKHLSDKEHDEYNNIYVESALNGQKTISNEDNQRNDKGRTDGIRTSGNGVLQEEQPDSPRGNRNVSENGWSEADDNGNSENAVAPEGEQVGYSITPTTYVTKANKVLDMHLLVFDRPLGKEEHKSAREIAKSLRGWYDAKEGGYMMRSEEDAKSLANAMLDKEVVESTQPVSLVDSNDYVANIRSILDKYDDVISDITKEITNDSALMGALKDTDSVQSIALIGQAVGEHVSKNFSTLSEIGFVSAWDKHRFTINEAVEVKVKQIRRKREYEELRAKGVNGFKIGDKVMYKGAVATIHDFEDYGDNNPVLDTGMAPVIYEVSEWSDVSKIDEDTPEAKLAKIKAENPNAVIIEDPSTWVGKTFFTNGMRLKCTDVGGGYASFDNLDTYMGMGYDISVVQNFLRKGEWAHVEEKKSSEKSPSKPKESKLTESKVENPSGNKLVTDERYAELRERMRKKLGGQMNMGIDPEILAIGTEMAVYHIEKGARKFKDYATDMIADLGDAIRPYLKAFYNGARELPEVEDAGFVNEMTPYEEVKSFDVANFDKVVSNPLDTADAIAKEAEVEKQAEEATEKIKNARNDKRIEFINNLRQGDRVILKDGRNTLIVGRTLSGNKVESFYGTYKGKSIDFTPDKIDVDATLKFREDLTSKTSESTENSVPLQDNKLHREFVKAVTTDMLSALDTNERPYRSIVDIRKRAKEVGIEVDNEGRDDILLQELVEDGLVRAARLVNISWGGGKYSRRSFDEICQLYAMQPTIAQRSSNRIKMQQYSTPLPMAWVANHFAMHGKKDGKVLEPTAGNGMLVFSIPPKQVHVNELDETRLANLREQGFAEVTQQDATEPFEGGKQYDVVLANPPFGKRDAVEFDGDKISGLDPQITLNALDAMKDDGRAAIIIGGNFEYRPNGAIKDKPAFWSHLYNHYNVVGVVDMSGDMYARQGTTFPTRMILINGRRSEEDRKQGTCYPPVQADAVRKAETFDDLYEIVNELIEFNLNNKTNGTIISSEGLPSKPVSDKPQGETGQVGYRRQSKKGDSSIEQVQRGLDSGAENPLVAVLGNDNANGEQSRPDKREDDRSGNQGNDVRVELEGGNATEGSGVRTRTDSADGGRHGGIGRQRLVDSVNDNIGTSSVRSSDVLVERKLDTEKLPYRPHNTAFSLESVAPAHMVEAMDAVLSDIESQYGNIDQFVTDELGYNSVDEMHNALAAEQVDSVAMAIYQMKQGKAMIIGDQTGVGKGRQMASLIRWAVKQGKTPIFATQKADLFSDIYRDLVDIGSGDLVPFIFNARTGKNKGEMVDADGKVVHRGLTDTKMKEVLKSGVLPEGYDFVVLTYSQVNNGPEHPKAKLLANIAKDNYLFLDESHTAAGESKTGECFQNAVASAKAVTFASATYAKRPDTMPLYALRTSMNEANVGMDELIDIIKRGGVTLQEIMSRELTNAGQMVRRERDMSDVVTDWEIVDDAKTSQVARDNYDRTINAFNAIIKFQEDYVNPTLKGESEKVAREMKSISKTKGTDKVGIDNTPFASHTFNYTKQLMLALKVDAIIDYVDREIKAGRHPVIALENTMESSYKDFNDGEELDDTSFSRGLLKGLDSTLKYTINNNGDKIPGVLYPYQLIGDGEAKYYELQKFIYESTKDIFISPLDAIIDGLHRKGYRVGELTGRSKVVSIEGDKAVVRNRKDTDKKKLQREFNSGLLDVLILNKSAATGISLHASERFSDQRQRTMILVQPLSDINDYMQMIGRIDRTGQVHRGYYINLGLPIPAENRFLMMLSTKLKSLNANTTTSQDSESNEVKAPDLLNKYGGQVIIEYLRDNPDVYVKIGEPLSGVSVDDLETYTANDETASKITGRVALLTIKEQEDFYDDVIRRYNDLINYLNDTGTNDLKINVVPLRAETIAKRVTSNGKDPNGNNPFAQDAYLEKVEMDVIRKPMKSAEVQKTIEKVNDGLSHNAHLSKIADIVTAETSAKVDKEVERHNKATERVNAEIESHTKRVNKMDKLSEEEKQKVIENYANTKIADIADKHSTNLSKLRDAQKVYFDNLKLFTTGDTYLIPDNLETLTYSTLSPAIFCGYKTKDSKITASTTFAVFAVLDGRRKIEIKLSEMSKLKNIYYATMQNIGTAKSTNLSNWDSQMPNETRREGYILTGNILQAVADTMDENGNYTGQLVSYTDIDGNVRDGVLMPDNWNPKLLKSGKAPLISKLTQIKNGERVESSDGDVVIAKNRWGYTYTLSVPKTKKRGGKFFEDTELLNLVSNGVFYPNRGRLQADVISERIDRVVQRLTELDVKVEAEKSEDDVMFRTSEEIEAEYPNWLEGTTTDSGKHSTQVEGTRKTYNKVGTWIENNLGKDVSILDASSGMGYGTLDLRERGFNIEDVEPYQSEERKQSNPATYSSYDAIGKEYDYIISNAVLNVIPDDWRANVLHDMAKHLKAGGKMFINTRKAGEEKHIKDKIELDSPQEVLVKRNGKIASYQRFFTPSELKAWVESELGDGYSVEVANEKNSGTKGLAAVVVTKNSDNLRQGEGAYTDAEVSFANDLVSRAWGENLRSKKQQQSFANRIRKQMRQHAQSLAETLRVPIEILDNPNALTGKKARAKGFYDKKTGKATVILSNNNSLEDIEATVLHELVGHYGLRELFGENFDRFLYNVYTHAEADVKERINRLARKNNWDFAKATEEYLASLAEDEGIYRNSQDQTRWLFKIKRFFMEMLRTLGFNYLGPSLSDNELKYVLWCSYQNLQGELNPIFKTASDVAMQSALKVGQFEEQTPKQALASESREFDNEPDVLLRDTEDSVARDMYERKLASTAYQSTEAFQDSMLGLKVFQDAVLEANGKGKEAIADFENAYMAENALSSKNYAQTEEFKNRLFIPLVTEMARLEPSGEYGNLYDYMMAKHGLERNRVMAERDAEAFFENYEGEDTFEEILAKFRKNDYSGLTSLTGEEDVESAEEIAYQMVEDYENSHNTSALWDKINACTADILKKQFEGGLISRDTYNQISAMYENYIPLRGWKETTADDVYTYLTSKSGAFNAPIRTARGRSSVADNPIATIAHMAESGIAQANRNKLKQQFYNFCLNNPSNLASISDVWLQHNPVTDEWEVVSPQIDADATAEEVEQIMSDFNERMKSLAEENPDEYKKGSQAKGIPYKIGKGMLSEHQVLVKVNGKDIIITINGNPRAAQAVNGLTNPDSEMSGAIGNLLKLTNYVNRQLSAFYTTRNPEFVVSNFFRDAIYANSMVWVKESPNYAVKFNSNFGKVNPAKMHQLIRKYRNGSLDMSNEIEKAFYDFMVNGGETGYTQMRDLEAYKKELDKALKYSQGKMPVRKAWNMFFDRCDEINRAVENCARFAAFVTSRQMGRTIQRSVYDAKEISVNFNKKGAGDKFLKSNNATAKWASLISGVGRIFYVFWNAGIQGMANFAKASKNNPKDAILACAAMFVSGALVAMLGYDDEERDYYNLPEYVRRSNLCFKVGNSWVTIPLPIEYRAIYGLGELCASVINGGDKYTPKETAEKVAQQFSQLLPLDMLEGGGGWNPLIPTFAKPWAEAYVFNTDWTGLPIYKENTFNELYPEFTKAYKNANDILVGTSEYLNDVSGGNAYKKGEIDFNPAKLEYVLEGYFGGLATTFNKMVKMGETAFGDREFEWRNMLIASRLVKEGDERQETKRVQNQYYNYKQEAEETSNQVRGFRGEKRKGVLDNADELDFLHHSPEYLRYTIFNEYDDDITALNKKIKEMPDGKEKDNLVIELDALRKELVDQLDATLDLTKEEAKQITTTDPNVNYYRAKEEDADYKEVEIDPLDERFKNATTEEQAKIQKEIDDKMETEGFNHWSNVHDALNAVSNTKRAIKSGEAPKNYNDTIHNIKKEIADMRRSYFGNSGLKNKEEGEQ